MVKAFVFNQCQDGVVLEDLSVLIFQSVIRLERLLVITVGNTSQSVQFVFGIGTLESPCAAQDLERRVWSFLTFEEGH